uniref:Uncharacterized protein n=1 Tax=Fagus sylvatica TaxID=28930 RepID=A0A2N9GIL4_FAGSY
MGLTAMWWCDGWSHGGWVSRDGEGNGSRRMGFTGWGMVKGVGHGGGAMGWRGGGEVVIGGSSRRYQWKPKNKKSKKKAAAGKGGSRFGETAPFHCFNM